MYRVRSFGCLNIYYRIGGLEKFLKKTKAIYQIYYRIGGLEKITTHDNREVLIYYRIGGLEICG